MRNDPDETPHRKPNDELSEDEEPRHEKYEDENELTPDGPKIGERQDNLRRRSEWFQKRTGGR